MLLLFLFFQGDVKRNKLIIINSTKCTPAEHYRDDYILKDLNKTVIGFSKREPQLIFPKQKLKAKCKYMLKGHSPLLKRCF